MHRDKIGEFFYHQSGMISKVFHGTLIVFLCVGIHADCFGLTYSTPEGCTADAVAIWSKIYSLEHGGKPPSAWNDLSAMFDVPLEELMPHSAPVKRYAFVSPSIPLLPPHKGDLITINRSDICDSTLATGFFGFVHGLQGPGRNMIIRTPDGEFHRLWVLPDYVHQVFESASTPLPLADTEPERIWVTKARNAVLTRRLIYGVLIVGLLYIFWQKVRGRSLLGNA